MESPEKFLREQLQLLLGCNGDLAKAIQNFREKYTDRNYRKGLVELALSELLKLSTVGLTERAVPEELESFVARNNRLLDILTEIGAGGVYNRLLDYSANISSLPIAKDWRGKFFEWASELKVAASEVMATSYFRENSANPPY
jgi:hypothetical protein